MPTLEQIRAAHVGKLSAIAGIGRVHGYERYAKLEADFRNLYVSGSGASKRVCGWYVRRVSTVEKAIALGRWETTHGWLVRGFMAIDDDSASEIAFDALIEAVREAYRADDSLNGLVDTMTAENGEAMKLEESAPVLFAGVLCHSARLRVSTRHST